jgi:uncharacterized protein YgbK (DUF1537 family)
LTWSDNPHTLIGVIADDLTGQNATGILLRRRGFRTASLTGMEWPSDGLRGYDCVCVNTDSRALPARKAYDRVARAAAMIRAHQGRPLAKRIDSTLRGNLGAELEAVLNAIGPASVAVVTGAFPASGRTTRGGNLYVGGVLLAETAVRHDPRRPITESHVPTLLAAQTQFPVGYLALDVVRAGAEAVAPALRKQAKDGIRMICADAETDEDITAIGMGMALSGLCAVAADPGPLTAAYVAALTAHRRRRVMVVTGSVALNTVEQLALLERELGAHLVTVDAGALARGEQVAEREITRVVDLLAAIPRDTAVMGVKTSPLMNLPDQEAAELIAAGFAELTARSLQSMPDIAGMYTSGGDITLAVCRRLGATAINLVEEILPLAVAGRLLGGIHPDLYVVTKGGLVGGPDAAVRCVNHILKEVQHHD